MPRVLLLLALLLTVAAACAPGAGSKFRSGPNVTIGANEMAAEDLYLSGGTVNVRAAVDGDITAAGGQVTLGEEVTGDVTAAGGQVSIQGPVGDDLRVAGGNIALRSDVADDAIAAGGTVELASGATVGGDLVTGAGTSEVRGTVEGDLIAGSGELVISGTVLGNADVQAGEVTLEPGARIEGDLRYVSPREATLQPGSQVLGSTTREVPRMSIAGVEVEDTAFNRGVAAVVGQVQWLLGTIVVGLLLLLLVPHAFQSARRTLESSPWASLGMGILMLVLVPIVIIVVGIIAFIIGGLAGAPVAIVPLAAYVVLLALATPVVALVVGRFPLRRFRSRQPAAWLSLVLGAIILALLGLVPILNVVVGVLTILFGFGAWLLFGWRGYRYARRVERV